MSACFAAADLGLALPVVLIGFVSQPIGTVDASAHVAPLLAVVILAAAIVVARTFGRETQPTPPPRMPTPSASPPWGSHTPSPVAAMTEPKASETATGGQPPRRKIRRDCRPRPMVSKGPHLLASDPILAAAALLDLGSYPMSSSSMILAGDPSIRLLRR